MKSGKIKSAYLAVLAVIVAALFFGLFALNIAPAYAEGNEPKSSLSGSGCKNFIYSAEFTPAGGAFLAGVVFGADEETGWGVFAETAEDRVALYRQEEEATTLKKVGYSFTDGEKFRMTLVVNEGVAKVFLNNETVAALTCKLDGYEGGVIVPIAQGYELSGVELIETDTPDGDLFVGGYGVLKVVNLTDGNYILKDGEYSVSAGVLTISREYLKTLEADGEYLFRAVTDFTDFNFKVMADFTSVSATPATEKFYRNTDVTLELSSNVTVHKLFIDGKEVAFTQTGERVVISSKVVGDLSTGKHSIKLFTDKGRPETSITVSELVETITEPEIKSAHVWLWIDVAIFASAIVGYITYSIISKRKQK